MARRSILACVLLVHCAGVSAQESVAGSPLAELVPVDFPVLIEAPSLTRLVERLLALPPVDALSGSILVRRLVDSGKASPERKLFEILRNAGAEATALAIRPGELLEDALLLFRAKDEEAASVAAAALAAAKVGVERAGALILAAMDEEILKSAAVLRKGGRRRPATLAEDPLYKAAQRRRKTGDLFLFANLNRTLNFVRNVVFPKRNAFEPLLLGPILPAVRRAPFMSVSLSLSESATLEARLPHQPLPEKDAWCRTCPTGRLATPGDSLLRASLGRDLSGWWRLRDELTGLGAEAELAEFENGMNLLFGQVPFADVIGALGPGVEAVVSGPRRLEGQDPAEVHPAFAVCFTIKDRAAIEERLFVAFQSAISLGNLSDDGKPKRPFVQGTSTVLKKNGKAKVDVAFAKPIEDKVLAGHAVENYSPSAAIDGDRLILSSSLPLMVELLDAEAPAPAAGGPVDAVEISGRALAGVLAENRMKLESDLALQNGLSTDDASKELSLFLNAIRAAGTLSLRVFDSGSELKVEVDLRTDAR